MHFGNARNVRPGTRSFSDRFTLQQRANLIMLADRLFVNPQHDRPFIGPDFNQPIRSQYLKRFTHGHTGHANHGGDPFKGNFLPFN
jgi:hypothetical protein